MMNERHHNNTEPSVAVATEAMNRNELYGARGDFPDTDDISGPIEQGERERPEKRRKVGSDVAADDLKKPSATPDAVEIIADDAPLLSTNSEFTSTESMPPASAFASTGTAASAWTVEPAKPQQQQPMRLKQGMPAPTSFLSQQQQHLPQHIFPQNQQALPGNTSVPNQQTMAPSNSSINVFSSTTATAASQLQQQRNPPQHNNSQIKQFQSPFLSMENQVLLQNQFAAYQAGLMGLPPQFLHQALIPSALSPQAPAGLGSNVQQAGGAKHLSVATASAGAVPPISTEDAAKLSGRNPQPLFMSCDEDSLSEYQCLVRKQIELFEARPEDVASNAKGRNKPIVIGQVGIRCRHCRILPPKSRQRGATYYPAKLNGLYQAAQSMASGHLCYHCQHIPQNIRQELLVLRERKSSAGGGKKYWGDGCCVLGVFEDENGLRFKREKI